MYRNLPCKFVRTLATFYSNTFVEWMNDFHTADNISSLFLGGGRGVGGGSMAKRIKCVSYECLDILHPV